MVKRSDLFAPKKNKSVVRSRKKKTSTALNGGMKENAVHRGVVHYLRLFAVPGCSWFHPANGELRPGRTGAILVGMGVRPGVPDLILVRRGHFYGLELKREKGGSVSAHQKSMLEELSNAGASVAIAHGYDAAIAQLTDWGLVRQVSKGKQKLGGRAKRKAPPRRELAE